MEKSEFIKVRGRNFVCQLCDIKITSEKAVDDHLTGKKHQRLLSLQISRQERTQKSVFVGGLSRLNGELELGDYFSKFGDVAQIFIDKEKAHYAIVEFTSQESAKKATAVEKQLMNGHKIVVRPRQPKTGPPETSTCGTSKNRVTGKGESHGKGQSKPAEPGLDETLCQRLQQEATVADQMSSLVQLKELSQADQRLRRLICDLLQSVLEEFLPGCRITPFGSSVNGFGVQGCDLDVHLEVSATTVMEVGQKPTPAEVDKQNLSSSTDDHTILDIASATPLDILTLVSDVIKRCVPSCHKVHTIPSTRLPVVTFTHKESCLQCDITLNNRLALQNSKLLKFYSQLETQVRPLVFTIRQWAKLRQLAGNTGAGPRLTNYALTLMVLFYLQAKDEPVIPSVAELDQTHDGWDSVFSTDKIVSATDSTQSQDDLLAGFFRFYGKFDFTTSVICPLLGKTTSLSEVLQEGSNNSGRTFKSGAVNIQDPFELWHNVALNVNEKTASRLSSECGIAAQLCQTELAQKQSGSSLGTFWGLLTLFDSTHYSSAKTRPSVSSKASKTDNAVVEINLKASHLSERFIAEHPDPDDLRSAWCVAVRRLAYQVLSEVLRFECCRLMDNQKKADTTKVTCEQQQNDPDCSTNSQLLESRPSGPDCTDSPTDATANTRDYDCKPPPTKRCRVEDCQDPRHSPIGLVKQCSGDSNQEGPTSTHSNSTWGSATETLECTAYHHVWLGRRKARRQLRLKDKSRGGTQTTTNLHITKQPCLDQGDNMNSSENPSSFPKDNPESASSDNICNLGEKQSERTGPCQKFTHISTGDSSNASQIKDRSCDTQTESRSVSDNFLLESRVTDLIIAEKLLGDIASSSSVLKFHLELKDNISHGTTSVQMHFLTEIEDADFKVFLHFFDIFFKKMLEQCKV
ncbi:speckle targeted PIP5K1A-regulated poly(A) polymerase-like [Patiria miniata]|uniref:Speckle targeted PIP5K1A-regulated poly(A) polymerase n=1 Tax=Patiria miniata TaxID=46514 RepID=A0A914BMU4_PATMI|nr:speckle targeted PIP5K1A-regulated poly(A) polymerase-like [Patiria miniata]